MTDRKLRTQTLKDVEDELHTIQQQIRRLQRRSNFQCCIIWWLSGVLIVILIALAIGGKLPIVKL